MTPTQPIDLEKLRQVTQILEDACNKHENNLLGLSVALEIAEKRDAFLRRTTSDVVLRLLDVISAQRKALEFFAEPFTWSRVVADYRSDVRLNDMYGSKAREAIAEVDRILSNKGEK